MAKIRVLALANGDIYRDIIFQGSDDDILQAVEKREFMRISVDKTHSILINSDFIVSLEY